MRSLVLIASLLAAVPAGSRAEQPDEAPGLDLSQPPKPADGAAKAQGEELPPIDLSAPPTPRSKPAPPEKTEPRPERPFSEQDVALGDKVKAVQRKGFLKRGRFELAPLFAATMNDAFYQKFGGGARLAYNFQDSFALAVRGAYYREFRADNIREGKLAFQSQLLASQIQKQVMVDGIWSPIYGKAAFREQNIVHFDLFLAAGFGMVWSSTSGAPLNQGPHVATDLGGGLRFYPKDWLAFELGLIATLYPDQAFPSLPATIQKVFVANVGVSFFLPPSFDYVYP